MPRTPAAAHARFSPSGASRWLNCVASIRLAEQLRAQPGYVEPESGEAANLGRQLHSQAEALLPADDMTVEAALASLPPERRSLIEPYLRHVRDLMNQIVDFSESDAQPELRIEQLLRTGIRDVWGTTDAVVINSATFEAWIIDLKTGHQRVEAEENKQLMVYALGVYQLLSSDIRDRFMFHLQIVQPRDEEQPIKSWSTNAAALLSLRTRIRGQVSIVDTAAPVMGEWCTYCPAAANCPLMQHRTMSVFNADGVPPADPLTSPMQPMNPLTLSPESVSFFLTHATKIEAFLEACKQRALHETIPGWKVVEARTRRRWVDVPTVVAQLLETNRADLLRQQPATIGDVERALGRNHPLITEFAIAPRGAPSVVPESDPRPVLDRAQVFDRIEEGDPT